MPIQWTADADAKLFLGVLIQMRGRVKLDYEDLAAHMGSDCTACAVEQRIVKLKKQVAGKAGSPSNASTPATTPKKRAAGQSTKTPTKKAKLDHAETSVSPQKGNVRVSGGSAPVGKSEVKAETKAEMADGIKQEEIE
ncbi:hypothetical protein BO70DRAFT_366062 [Aspergillus heteromorphus CBS 117.55]|uniref:Uncharacterized protein n=1 Tax=Aspergillus heteromorphus CBS 117.55 TaxID=1448321 RepID=A0A317V259_9EURO|nr:uncharacterized protein BO70DRAFT_366062 [Aspergillus heteromorphus CBS 117.55]PWY68394.1 hypothetical protein BO70DRAFT_366062 [Aspergillus heteromorphus CBS 117.55]